MMTRTSSTHPLQIASLSPGKGLGRIGITFCPGKKQRLAATGAWDRDLGADLGAIRRWGAAVVVTLVEDHELHTLGVPTLGEEVRRAHMGWVHLPITDVSVPGSAFEQAWQQQGQALRACLQAGFDILVHCKGGLGRAGMIAARLMVELGSPPDEAIAKVRAVRPGAVETRAQEDHVRKQASVQETQPSASPDAICDRALGALLGLAAGDAVGTALEFRKRDTYEPVTGMSGGGPFCLKPGEWTDDTAMALALAESLLARPCLDEHDLMRRFSRWRDDGAYSCTGTCFDIGMTVSSALARWQRTGNPAAGSAHPMSAGNGSLMRLAPAALRYWNRRAELAEVAARQSRTTHAAPEAVSACIAFAGLLAEAIAGKSRAQVLAPRKGGYAPRVGQILAGSWRGKPRDEISSSGYVIHSLEAALWSIGRTADFRSAVLLAANLGEDADTTAAITGQLAGALYGMSGIPEEWLAQLAWRERIKQTAHKLFAASQQANPSSASTSPAQTPAQ